MPPSSAKRDGARGRSHRRRAVPSGRGAPPRAAIGEPAVTVPPSRGDEQARCGQASPSCPKSEPPDAPTAPRGRRRVSGSGGGSRTPLVWNQVAGTGSTAREVSVPVRGEMLACHEPVTRLAQNVDAANTPMSELPLGGWAQIGQSRNLTARPPGDADAAAVQDEAQADRSPLGPAE